MASAHAAAGFRNPPLWNSHVTYPIEEPALKSNNLSEL